MNNIISDCPKDTVNICISEKNICKIIFNLYDTENRDSGLLILHNLFNKNISFIYNFTVFFRIFRTILMAYHGLKNETSKIIMADIIDILESHPDKNVVIIYNLQNNFKVNFKGEKPYMGCELEIAFKDKTLEMDCLIELWNIEGIHLMNDDSISGIGFEIITNPMGFQEQVLFFKRILNIINKYGGFCDSSCGFHIHIDKNDEIVKKVESITNQINIELIGKRKTNEYCKLKRKNENDRYTAINLTNKETIELRFFRCTLIFKNILQYLLYAHNLVKYSEEEFIEKYKKYKYSEEELLKHKLKEDLDDLNKIFIGDCSNLLNFINKSFSIQKELSSELQKKNIIKIFANMLNCFNKNDEVFKNKGFIKSMLNKMIELNDQLKGSNLSSWTLKWNSIYNELLPKLEQKIIELNEN